jgi:TonB family protein
MKFLSTLTIVLATIIASAQTRQITGRVVDEETQKGLPGATVTIADTDKRVVTNQLGFFALEVTAADKALVMTSIGHLAGKIDVPPANAFKAGLKREYLLLETLNLGSFSAEQLEPPDTLEAPGFDKPEMDAEYPGGWQYFYNAVALSLQMRWNQHLIPDTVNIQFTVLPNGITSVAHLQGASDSLRIVVEDAFKTLRPWKPAKQNKFYVAQHFELPLSWPKVDEIFTVVEQSATPIGGIQAFYNFVGKSIKYPAQARRMGIEGKVFVEFIIQKDGTITDARVIKGIGGGCDQEALRVISLVPKWNPGVQRGNAVRQRYTLPIYFRLDGPAYSGRGTEKPMAASYQQWISENIKYPATATRMGVEGLVVVSFKVTDVGLVDSLRLVQDIGADCGKEVIRVMSQVPQDLMMPLRKHKKVMYLPFKFSLDDNRLPDLKKWDRPGTKLLEPIGVTVWGGSSPRRGGARQFEGFTMSAQNFDSFEDALKYRGRVVQLELVRKSIRKIPPEISKFNGLQILDLEMNKIQSLPPQIGELTKLSQLYLVANELSDLPIEFANLRSLRTLGLANNRFEQFPRPVLGLSGLTALDLSRNKISVIPAAIGEMRNLEMLFLHDNQITTLPEEFYQLTQLKVLSLGGNQISEADKTRIREVFKKTDVKFE